MVAEDYEADDAMTIEQWRKHRHCEALARTQMNNHCTKESTKKEFLNMYTLWKGTVICSRDKDLKMVPGYHYSWGSGKQPEKETWFVPEEEGHKFFFTHVFFLRFTI